jgi:hypothetical protein
MIPNFEIKNGYIKQYYDYLVGVYNNEEFDKTHRQGVSRRIEVILNLVRIYEQDEVLTFDDLSWVEMGIPLLPEEKREMVELIYNEQRRNNLRLVK